MTSLPSTAYTPANRSPSYTAPRTHRAGGNLQTGFQIRSNPQNETKSHEGQEEEYHFLLREPLGEWSVSDEGTTKEVPTILKVDTTEAGAMVEPVVGPVVEPVVEPQQATDDTRATEASKDQEASIVHTIVGNFIQKHSNGALRPVGTPAPTMSFCGLLGLPTVGPRIITQCLRIVVRPCDVVRGSLGRRWYMWPGNQSFRRERDRLLPAYTAANLPSERHSIIIQLTNFVKNENGRFLRRKIVRNENGRFLHRLNRDSDDWVVITSAHTECFDAFRHAVRVEARRRRREHDEARRRLVLE